MFCNMCGTQLPDDSFFCLKCGNRLQTLPEGMSATPPEFNDLTVCDVVLNEVRVSEEEAISVLCSQNVLPIGFTEAKGMLSQLPALAAGELIYAEAALLCRILEQGGLAAEVVTTPAERLSYQEEFDRISMKYSNTSAANCDDTVYARNSLIYSDINMYKEAWDGGIARSIVKSISYNSKVKENSENMETEIENSRKNMMDELNDLNQRHGYRYYTYPADAAANEMAVKLKIYIHEKTRFMYDSTIRTMYKTNRLKIYDNNREIIIKWMCYDCGTENELESVKCVHCGKPRPDTAQDALRMRKVIRNFILEEGAASVGKWVCPFCGEENGGGSAHCISCGEDKPFSSAASLVQQDKSVNESQPQAFFTTAETAHSAKTWDCPRCGMRNKARNSSCLHCNCPKPAQS